LLFLNRVSQGVAIFPAIVGDVNLPPLRGGMEWVCRKPEKQFSLAIVVDGDNTKWDYRYELTVKVGATKAEVSLEKLILVFFGEKSLGKIEETLFQTNANTSDYPGIPIHFWNSTKSQTKRFDLNRTSTVLSQIETLNVRDEVREGAKKVLAQLRNIFVFDPIPSHMRDFAPLSETLLADGSNLAGVLAGLEPERKTHVEETLTRYLKDLPERDIKRIWTEPVGKFKTDAMLYCEEGWESEATHEIDARGMSDGTLRYLAIVTALLTRNPGGLLVVEEVDNGLHPSRAHVLVDMLQTLGQERRIDVLVTTHNPALLDAAGVTMVPFITVAHRDDATGFSQLIQLEDIDQLPKLLAGGSLGQLSAKGRIESALKRERAE
jgi:hypothetical protein